MDKTIYSKEQKELVKKLRDARKKTGLSQRQVAVKLGFTQSYISKIESGQTKIDVFILQKLTRLYNLNIKELVGQKDETKKSKS